MGKKVLNRAHSFVAGCFVAVVITAFMLGGCHRDTFKMPKEAKRCISFDMNDPSMPQCCLPIMHKGFHKAHCMKNHDCIWIWK